MAHDDIPPDGLRLRAAALDLVRDTAEGRALNAKLDAFDTLDDAAKKKDVQDIQEDLADIVARAVTEDNHRKAFLDALINFRNDQALTDSEPADIEQKHPLAAELLDVAQDILVELGKEMLIEAVLPGVHILLPPTDFVDSLFTAVEILEIAEEDDPWTWP
jgi:hypothetical protein